MTQFLSRHDNGQKFPINPKTGVFSYNATPSMKTGNIRNSPRQKHQSTPIECADCHLEFSNYMDYDEHFPNCIGNKYANPSGTIRDEKVWVYDNGGKSLDRYTVVIDDGYFGMSERPFHPQGFNQYGGHERDLGDRKHLGKLLDHIPEEIYLAVEDRISST